MVGSPPEVLGTSPDVDWFDLRDGNLVGHSQVLLPSRKLVGYLRALSTISRLVRIRHCSHTRQGTRHLACWMKHCWDDYVSRLWSGPERVGDRVLQCRRVRIADRRVLVLFDLACY